MNAQTPHAKFWSILSIFGTPTGHCEFWPFWGIQHYMKIKKKSNSMYCLANRLTFRYWWGEQSFLINTGSKLKIALSKMDKCVIISTSWRRPYDMLHIVNTILTDKQKLWTSISTLSFTQENPLKLMAACCRSHPTWLVCWSCKRWS